MTPRFATADLELLRHVSDWDGPKQLHELDAETLSQISRRKGVDFATSLLYDAIRTSADHGPFIERMGDLLSDSTTNRGQLNAVFVIAPGAFYREHPETGADGQTLCRLAATMGCRTHVIPTESVGSAAANGRNICDWLSNNDEENVILCSLSKGGADVKMALAEPDARGAFRNVAAWLNVGGIPSGSPMATWILERPLLALIYRAVFWLRAQDFLFVQEIARRAGSQCDIQVIIPSHMRVIHVLGFPLAHHLRSRPTRRWHRRLSYYGPNDGATILADCCALPGLIFPVWGEDHYLNAGQSPARLLTALLHYLAEELNLFARPPRPVPLANSAATT